MTIISSPANPDSDVRPLLSVDRVDVHLTSTNGDSPAGNIVLTNSGGQVLKGAIIVRLGAEWLRVSDSAVHLQAGQTQILKVYASAAALPSAGPFGEITIATNGGEITVRVSVAPRGLLRGYMTSLIVTLAIVAIIAAGIVVMHGRTSETLPAARHVTAPVVPIGTRHGHQTSPAPTVAAILNLPATIAAVKQTIAGGNAIWQAALTLPSADALSTVETGAELSLTTAEVQSLVAGGEHWQITLRQFAVEAGSIAVAGDGLSASGTVQKRDQRSLFGPDHPGTPYETFDAVYRLRYHLVHSQGRWMVDRVTVLAVTPVAQSGPPLTVPQVSARVLPVVMHIEADSPGQVAVGTGIVVHSSATTSDVLTNDHVVTGATTVKLQRYIHGGYLPAEPWIASRVWEDAADDLAVVRINQGDLPVVSWADEQSLQPGQSVVAVGYAEDLSGGPTITQGIVSSEQRTAPDAPAGPTYIGHSAPINHGNSGGPLVDMNGRLIGINTWTLDNTQGLYFAIPATRAARVIAAFHSDERLSLPRST